MTAENDEKQQLLATKTSYGSKPSGFGSRYTLALLGGVGGFFSFALRFNLSIAIVSMTNSSTTVRNYTQYDQCSDMQNTTNSGDNTRNGEFDWDEATQGLLLSSFFYGYVATQIPGGFLSEKVGGKQIFGLGICIPGIIAIFIPLLCQVGSWALMVARILQGFFEGATWPALATMQGKWYPKSEMAFLMSVSTVGAIIGNIVCLPLTGVLCDYGPFGGWPSSFYFIGAGAILWYLIWHCVVHESPSDHPRISQTEKKYIESTTGERLTSTRIPWLSILTSPAVWALNVAFFCQAWGTYSILTVVPTYMTRVLKFDMSQNGLLMALPNITAAIGRLSVGYFSDIVSRKNVLSTKNIRKIPVIVCSVISTGSLCLISYVGCERGVIITLISLVSGLVGLASTVLAVNVLDIGYNFAGIVMGICNLCGNLSGVAAPYVAGLITNNNQTMGSWRTVFFIGAGQLVLCTCVFGIFAKGSSESWNLPKCESGNSKVIQVNETKQ